MTALLNRMGFRTRRAVELTLTGNQAKKGQHHLPWSTADQKKVATALNEGDDEASVRWQSEGVRLGKMWRGLSQLERQGFFFAVHATNGEWPISEQTLRMPGGTADELQ